MEAATRVSFPSPLIPSCPFTNSSRCLYDELRAFPALESGIDTSATNKFPGSTATYGSAASGAGDNREIPESEGGDINASTGQYVYFIFSPPTLPLFVEGFANANDE